MTKAVSSQPPCASVDWDWQAVGTLAAIAGLILTLLITIVQVRESRKVVEVDILLRLKQSFDEQQLRKLRAAAAAGLLQAKYPNQALSDLLDWLTQIGALVSGRVLSVDQAHTHFGYWLAGYWFSAQDFIKRERVMEPHSWKTLEKAIGVIVKHARKRTPQWTPGCERFLKREVEQANGSTKSAPAA